MKRSSACCPWLAAGSLPLLALGGAVFVLDQISKWMISSWLPHGGSRSVVDGFFEIVHARNTGMAFSLFADAGPWFKDFALPALQIAVIVVVLMMFRRISGTSGPSRIALALVLGGAAGNLVDRLLHGYVTDFLDFYVGSYHWPAFNVADSAITVGAALLILESLTAKEESPAAAKSR